MGYGGHGSVGRIRIEYCETLTGTTSPAASTQKLECYIVEQTDTDAGEMIVPHAVTDPITYTVQYGLKLDFATAGEQVTTLRVPAGMAVASALDALVSLPAAGDVELRLDVGNTGAWDWVQNASGDAAYTLTNQQLAVALNDYWTAQGAPVTGHLDVPVRVSLSQPGQVLLTNLQIQPASSYDRTIRVPRGTYEQFLLDLTAGETGSGPLALALDLGSDGTIDYSTSTQTEFPHRLLTGNLAAAVNQHLGTLGAGSAPVDLPIRIFVAGDAPIGFNDFTATRTPAVNLAATGLNVADSAQIANFEEGDTLLASTMLHNQGSADSGPVTAAFFAEAPGWGDWYIGSAFVENIPAGGSTPVEVEWNTLGFYGEVAVKAVVNPYNRVGETSTTNNTSTTSVTLLQPPPTVAFTAAPTTGEAPLTVQFTDTTTSLFPVADWQWDFGDGDTSSQQHPMHNYLSAGSYTVTLTVTDTNGLSAAFTAADFVLVDEPPVPPTAGFTALPSGGPAPLDVQFTDTTDSPYPLRSWAWDFGDGNTSEQQNPSHTYTTSGTYLVRLTATNDHGSDTHSTQIVVEENQTSVDIPLVIGWNLISIPIQPTNPAPAQVFASLEGSYTIVWAYDGCATGDPWRKYSPTGAPFANTLNQADVTQGIWIYSTAASTLTVTGTPAESSEMNLCTGWNLTGYPAGAQSPAQALATINGCYSIVWRYAAGIDSGVWQKYDPAAPVFANDLTTIEPTYGYWILAGNPCTWSPDQP